MLCCSFTYFVRHHRTLYATQQLNGTAYGCQGVSRAAGPFTASQPAAGRPFALLRTAALGLVIGAAVVGVYSVGLVAVGRFTTLPGGAPRLAALGLAVVCFGACLGAVAVGILLMVEKTGG
jgi:hypothetical protein